MLRPFSTSEVIATATPDFLRDAFHNGQHSHLRILSGAPQGWLEYASEGTLNQAERVILERKFKAPEGNPRDPRDGELRNTQEPPESSHSADVLGHDTPDQQKDNNNEPGLHASSSTETRGRSRTQNKIAIFARHQKPQERDESGHEDTIELTEASPRDKRATGKHRSVPRRPASMSGHVFRHALEMQAEIERLMPRQWISSPGLNLRLVKENEEWMKSGTLPPAPTTEAFQCPAVPAVEVAQLRYDVTEVCVANANKLTAALTVGNAIALNFANATSPGGGYLRGARAQEEDLCRLLPQLHPSLKNCRAYPIQPDVALVTHSLLAVRHPGTYERLSEPGATTDSVARECAMVTSAMPGGDRDDPRPGSKEWMETVRLRIRAVLHVSRLTGFPSIILGAFGCGAFGNPPGAVARIFVEQLQSPEFLGASQRVVFAIIDPQEDGNLKVFRKACARLFSDDCVHGEILPHGTTTQHTHTARKNPHEHNNTSATGMATNSQFTRRNTHTRTRRRTASTSPQRSDSGNGTQRSKTASSSSQQSEAANNAVRNINAIVIGLNGDTITKLKLNFNDSSLSVGHLYHHTKTHLRLSEKHFALVSGTHKLDDLSARFFCIPAVKKAAQTSPDNTIGLTMIRVARKAEPPADLAHGPPRQLRVHRERAPDLDNRSMAALNLTAGQGRPNLDFPTYPSTSGRHITTVDMQRDAAAFRLARAAQQRATPGTGDQPQTKRPMDTRARMDPVEGDKLVPVAASSLAKTRSISPADTPENNNIDACIARNSTPQAQADTDTNTKHQTPEVTSAPTPNIGKTGQHNTPDKCQAHSAGCPTWRVACEEQPTTLGPSSSNTPPPPVSSGKSGNGRGSSMARLVSMTAVEEWNDNWDWREETEPEPEKGSHRSRGRGCGADRTAASTGDSAGEPADASKATAKAGIKYSKPTTDAAGENRSPDTTWFKVVGALPMPWFECPHPLSIDDITPRATPNGCNQLAKDGPCCHLRIISGATIGWLSHADVASFKADAQATLQRSIRAAGGAQHTGSDGDKDMLRDLDDPEHQPIPRNRAKCTGSHYLHTTAFTKSQVLGNNHPHTSTSIAVLPRQSRQQNASAARTRLIRDQNQPSKRTGDHTISLSAGNLTWVKVTGAMPMEWTPLIRPFSIADVIQATDSEMSHDSRTHQECFCQLRMTSGCNLARLTP